MTLRYCEQYLSNSKIHILMLYTSDLIWLFQRKLEGILEGRLENGTLLQRTITWDSDVAQCDILSVRHDDDGNTFYNTIYWNDELEEHEKVQGVPREAFVFRENPYTADYLQQNVFRHDIRIPDEMFPDSWKNQLSQ
ncbi:hypothetical protein MHU86_9755 [Fragilaria crotonensis]|nr:hypothetical protein MHU86_9755 [Fragilaria crotonensis]